MSWMIRKSPPYLNAPRCIGVYKDNNTVCIPYAPEGPDPGPQTSLPRTRSAPAQGISALILWSRDNRWPFWAVRSSTCSNIVKSQE